MTKSEKLVLDVIERRKSFHVLYPKKKGLKRTLKKNVAKAIESLLKKGVIIRNKYLVKSCGCDFQEVGFAFCSEKHEREYFEKQGEN